PAEMKTERTEIAHQPPPPPPPLELLEEEDEDDDDDEELEPPPLLETAALIGVASDIAAVPHVPLAPAPPKLPPPPVKLVEGCDDEDELLFDSETGVKDDALSVAGTAAPNARHQDAIERSSPRAISHGVHASRIAGLGRFSSARKNSRARRSVLRIAAASGEKTSRAFPRISR